MKSDLPKVLHKLKGKPLVQHVVNNLKATGVDDIVLVIGYNGEMVQEALGDNVRYAWQKEQLGTGHAVLQAEELLNGYSGWVIIACGDVPLIGAPTFRQLMAASHRTGVRGAVLTMTIDNPTGYGRIIKDPNTGYLIRIVEEKDASAEEKKICEVNTGTYVFHTDFLFKGLKQINNNNAQGEYYLPDVIEYIRKQGYEVSVVPVNESIEGTGVNSPEELARLEAILA